MTVDQYEDLIKLAAKGIEEKWSGKNVDLGNGITAKEVKVNVIFDKKSDFKMRVRMGPEKWFGETYSGSNYPGFEFISYDTAKSRNNAVIDFKETAAHEFGHEVLSARKDTGNWGSMTHRGETSPWGSPRSERVPPASGTQSIMQYYTGHRRQIDHSRYKATNDDIRALFDTGNDD